MGMFTIPDLSPLSFPRTEDPVLEPPVPVTRVTICNDEDPLAGESYSPSHQQPTDDTEGETSSDKTNSTTSESSPTDSAAPQQVNIFV